MISNLNLDKNPKECFKKFLVLLRKNRRDLFHLSLLYLKNSLITLC